MAVGPRPPNWNIIAALTSHPCLLQVFENKSYLSIRSQHRAQAQQVSGLPGNLADMSLPQLHAISTQLLHVVVEGEKNLQAISSSGEGEMQRQQLRGKIELYKQRLRSLREVINMKTRPR